MRVFRQTHKAKSGKIVTSKNYTIEVKDHLGMMRKYPGFTGKRMTEAMGAQIKLLAAYRNAGQPPDAQLCEWLQGIPDKLRNRLAHIGLIDKNRMASAKPLSEHLADYRQSMGDVTKHARVTHKCLTKLFSECKFVFWSDIQASRLYSHLTRLRTKREIAQRTFNSRLKAAKAFCNWMVQDQRVSESPITHLRPIQITEREIIRRALEQDELIRLLDTTAKGPVRFGMTGHERYLLYRFAAETGLRANEIRSLMIDSFDFENLTVTVKAGSSKHKRLDVQVLRLETAALIREFFQNKTPRAKAFGGTYTKLTDRTADMVREDLAEAGIDYADEAGRVFDFHSLRHQTGSMLARYGVHPADAKVHMRHSDINLTLKYYTHLRKGAESETAAKLPDLSLPAERKAENKKA